MSTRVDSICLLILNVIRDARYLIAFIYTLLGAG
jgi:hypothetical protein